MRKEHSISAGRPVSPLQQPLLSDTIQEVWLWPMDNPPPDSGQPESYVMWSKDHHDYQYFVHDSDIKMWRISFRFRKNGTGIFAALAKSSDTGDNLTVRTLFFYDKDGNYMAEYPRHPEGGMIHFVYNVEVAQAGDEFEHWTYLERSFEFPAPLYSYITRASVYAYQE